MKKKAVSILMTAAMAASMLATTAMAGETEASTEAFDPGTGKVYLLNFKLLIENDKTVRRIADDRIRKAFCFVFKIGKAH